MRRVSLGILGLVLVIANGVWELSGIRVHAPSTARVPW